MKARTRLRPIVPGRAEGPIVKVESLSFYGEVDPEKGVLVADGRSIAGKILVIGRSRGSTVGSYVIYGLRYYNKAPRAIIMTKSEPIVIVGAIMANIPLYEGLTPEDFQTLRDNQCARVSEKGDLEILEHCGQPE